MTRLILHHYEDSPFSEKIRLVLGYKQLSWQSVCISPIMPRPDLMPLTGGYRKTPVMQAGADIYCDTAIITRYLESIAPEPSLYPPAQIFSQSALTRWADSALFQTVVSVCFQPRAFKAWSARMSPDEIQAFIEDRAALTEGATGMPGTSPQTAEASLHHYLQDIEQQSRHHGQVFLLGNQPGIADFAVYHCLWMVHRNPETAKILDRYPGTRDWMAAMKAFGHGQRSELSSAAALAQGTRATPGPTNRMQDPAPGDPEPGSVVEITPTDYGRVPVRGRLVESGCEEIILSRTDPQAGELHLHFPRCGFAITPITA